MYRRYHSLFHGASDTRQSFHQCLMAGRWHAHLRSCVVSLQFSAFFEVLRILTTAQSPICIPLCHHFTQLPGTFLQPGLFPSGQESGCPAKCMAPRRWSPTNPDGNICVTIAETHVAAHPGSTTLKCDEPNSCGSTRALSFLSPPGLFSETI